MAMAVLSKILVEMPEWSHLTQEEKNRLFALAASCANVFQRGTRLSRNSLLHMDYPESILFFLGSGNGPIFFKINSKRHSGLIPDNLSQAVV